MNVAIYIRMSTDGQEDSPERQRSIINPYVEAKGYTVVNEFLDNGISGWKVNRPEFQKMPAAKAGQFKRIVCAHQDRFSRLPVMQFLRIIADLGEAGVELETCDKGVLDTSDIGKLLHNVIGAVQADEESQTKAQRVASGMKNSAQEHHRSGGPVPFGYRRPIITITARNGKKKAVGGNPVFGPDEEVELVRQIFRDYAKNDISLRSLARRFNAAKIKSPKGAGWMSHTLRRILANPMYAGDYIWPHVSTAEFYRPSENGFEKITRGERGKKVKPLTEHRDVFPAIIDRDTFDKAQIKLTKVRGKSQARYQASRGENQRPLANGILKCGHCGGSMGSFGGNGRSPVYTCVGYRSGKCLNPHSVPESEILPFVVRKLVEEVDHDLLRASQDGPPELGHKSTDVTRLERNLAKIVSRLANVIDTATEAPKGRVSRSGSELSMPLEERVTQ